ncbi:MAG TPA: phage holin family protein [Verrucomicrobiota bacterium]|nr:hypothetical protein [Verrucomicrobiales bacterium]HRI14437.1 phage holin family protein [Verrucomicrobiota bacterium]
MSGVFFNFLQRWLVTILAVLVAAWLVPGIRYDTAVTIFLASLLLGFLNSFVRPLLLILSLPLLLVTLGLFVPVLNALLLMFVGRLVRGFQVDGFWPALWGGLVISIVSITINLLLGRGARVQVRRGTPRSPGDKGGDDGPVIDV